MPIEEPTDGSDAVTTSCGLPHGMVPEAARALTGLGELGHAPVSTTGDQEPPGGADSTAPRQIWDPGGSQTAFSFCTPV